jgi:hypothetical protein
MPSLLAEIGFISNPSEEQYLSTDIGQANIATSIFKAFRAYKYEIEGIKDTNAAANQPSAPKKTEAASTIAAANPPQNQELPKPAPVADTQKQAKANNPPAKKDKIWQPDSSAVISVSVTKADVPDAPKDFKPVDKVPTAVIDTTNPSSLSPEATAPKTDKKPVPLRDDNPVIVQKTEPASQPVAEAPKAIAPKEPAPKSVSQPREPVKQAAPPAPAPKAAASGKESVYFTVQLLAAKRKPGNYDDLVTTFGLIDREEIADGVVRYMAGEYPNFTEAKKAMELAHSKGIKDAFIVGYINKKRLDGKATYQLGLKYP